MSLRTWDFHSFCSTVVGTSVISFHMVTGGNRYYMKKIDFFFFYHVSLIISENTLPINVPGAFPYTHIGYQEVGIMPMPIKP